MNATVIDTVEDMPGVDLYTGALFTSGVPDLFYFQDSSLYIWQPDIITAVEPESDPVDPTAVVDLSLTVSPNPFNAAVTFTWPDGVEAQSLDIYNVLGERVWSFDVANTSGSGRLVWNGTDFNCRPLGSGVYFGVLSNSTHSAAVKLVLLK